jgi:hypothetical protein
MVASQLERRDDPAAPALVDPETENAIEEVVARSDAFEHAADS